MTPDVIQESAEISFSQPGDFLQDPDSPPGSFDHRIFNPADYAILPAADLAPLRADLAAAQAEAADWRAKCLETRALLNQLEDYADDPTPARGQALIDAFRVHQRFVEGNTPRTWVIGAPGEVVECAEPEDDVPWE